MALKPNATFIAARVRNAGFRVRSALAATAKRGGATPAAIAELKAASAEAEEATKMLSDYFAEVARAGAPKNQTEVATTHDLRTYTVGQLLASGSRFTNDYEPEDAVKHYLQLHPDADEAAVRADLQAEIQQHGG